MRRVKFPTKGKKPIDAEMLASNLKMLEEEAHKTNNKLLFNFVKECEKRLNDPYKLCNFLMGLSQKLIKERSR